MLSYQDIKERRAGLRSLVGTQTPFSRVADRSFWYTEDMSNADNPDEPEPIESENFVRVLTKQL